MLTADEIKELRQKLADTEAELAAAKAGCKHNVVCSYCHTSTTEEECPGQQYGHGGAECTICNTDLGWYCPASPDHTCYYNSEDEGRKVVLMDGTEFLLPPEYHNEEKHLEESDDWCIFCGAPDERK